MFVPLTSSTRLKLSPVVCGWCLAPLFRRIVTRAWPRLSRQVARQMSI